MRAYITPYKMGSKSAKALARGLGVLRSKGLKRFRRDTTLINWGSSNLEPRGINVKVINKPSAVLNASNKLLAFQKMREVGVSTVDFTTDSRTAEGWAQDSLVYGREFTSSSQGKGIRIIEAGSHVPSLPLYTKGVLRAHEYRVHVAFDRVIDFTKKKRRRGVETNPYIKNSSNGWVFCRVGVELPEKVKESALLAVWSLGLDFGAVDVLYKEGDDSAFVLEVNTACGLEGTTLNKYIETFRRVL